MKKYKNLGGDSGIRNYENGDDYIIVEFKKGKYTAYLYNYVTPGSKHVDHMKALAIAGQGLNSYITTVVKSNYAEKW